MTKATLAAATIGTALNFNENVNSKTSNGFSNFWNVFNNTPQNNANFSIDNKPIATRKKTKQGTKINYDLSASEKELLEYTNNNLLKGLENINVFSEDLQQYINKQIEAYKNRGIEELNTTYTPLFRELKNDIANRFGNLDNSIFLDNLNEIEKNRSNAIATLTENILAKQNELYETEMKNRYNYLNTLNNTNDSIYSKILNYLQLANN